MKKKRNLKTKKKRNPIIIAALIIVGGFFVYKSISYLSCMATIKDSHACHVLTFYGRAN